MAQDEDVEQKKSTKRLSSTADDDEPESKKRAETADKSWNVEDCRGDHESVEHWELRKQFLVENMERFPNRNRLVCLSQVFANMEFLGCRYPEETMELVHELSLGIVESYREKQKSRLQRTFVKASDAAERKTKGSSTNKATFTVSTNEHYSDSTVRKPINFMPAQAQSIFVAETSRGESSSVSTKEPFETDLHKLILLIFPYNPGENVSSIIHRSCSAVKLPVTVEYQSSPKGYMCTYQIGKDLIVESDNEHQTKEAAKTQAVKFVFNKLQKLCYTFVTKVQLNLDGKEVAKDEVDSASGTGVFGFAPKIPESNIGNKLLKLMGWSGGGLGKNEQGMDQAISVDGVVGRSRLGLGNNSKTFKGKITTLLEQQKRAGFVHDLKFASDFSKDERKEIHMIAQRLGLKSKSYGKDEDRFIVVSEKVSRTDLINRILAEGGETDQYKVVPPGGSLMEVEELIFS